MSATQSSSMQSDGTPPGSSLTPVSGSERIVALDVVRGFALLGIFLMNVEFFNRAIGEIGVGLPPGVTGIDYWAGWFVHVFVRGKFWTLFSLLFGMGFAVMLSRAEAAGRGFAGPYLRRTLALAVFGLLHYLLLWAGDILLAYAMGAALLMVVFYSRPRVLALLAGACLALAVGFGVAGAFGHVLPWQAPLGIGVPLLALAIIAMVLRRWPLSGMRNAGLVLYFLPFLVMTVAGLLMAMTPVQEREAAALKAATTVEQKAELVEQQQLRAGQIEQQADDIAEERRVMSGGSYAQAITHRIKTFGKLMAMNAGFSVIVVSVFLLGAWFIRSGIMAEPGAHLGLFRKMAWIGIPLGIGMSLAGVSIAPTHVPGENDGAFQLAMGLAMLGNLPACVGYLGAVVLLFHSRWRGLVAFFAPAGRMALTNYILQSVIGTWVFYGYGLSQWGLGRGWQLLFVLAVFALQILLSRWWLSRFRYGPLEWLWRSFTYLQVPAMRRPAVQAA